MKHIRTVLGILIKEPGYRETEESLTRDMVVLSISLGVSLIALFIVIIYYFSIGGT